MNDLWFHFVVFKCSKIETHGVDEVFDIYFGISSLDSGNINDSKNAETRSHSALYIPSCLAFFLIQFRLLHLLL